MSHRLPSLTPKHVISALQRGGFYIHHTTGSHYAMRRLDDPGVRVTIPYHSKDLRAGTLRSIIKQAGLAIPEFLQLL